MSRLSSPRVSVSWGELLDKITILEIKDERIADAAARANIAKELTELAEIGGGALRRQGVSALVAELKAVNEELWEIEDAIRAEEARGRFGPEFICLARSVYQRNDERAALKRQLNRLLRSDLVEEKSYWSGPERASELQPAEGVAFPLH